MDNEADLLWEWLPATITSRQDAAPTEKSQLPKQQGIEKRRLGLSAKAHGLLESAVRLRRMSISKGPCNAGSRPEAPFF
jgi:hypothetical protein